MGNLPSPESPYVLHMETRSSPGTLRQVHELIDKSAEAFADKGVEYATYTTIIGDPNVTHRFSGMSDLQGLGGQDTLHDALADKHGADYVPQHLETYKDVVDGERFGILRFEDRLSAAPDGDDPRYLLLMKTRVRPGTLRDASDLIARSAEAFKAHHPTAAYTSATTIVGDPNTIYRFAPITSLEEIGGQEDLHDVIGKASDDAGVDAHLDAYSEVVLEESFTLLRKA